MTVQTQIAMPNSPVATTRRLRLRFGLRFLLLLMMLSAFLAATIGYQRVISIRQEQAIAKLQGDGRILVGVRVRLLENPPPWFYEQTHTWIAFKRGWESVLNMVCGKRQRVDGLTVQIEDVLTDKQMALIADLVDCREISLNKGAVIRSDHFQRLASLPGLESFCVSGQSVDDAILARLGEQANLQRFCISSDVVTDSGFTKLFKLSRLTTLSMPNCPNVSSMGLEFLRTCNKLHYVDLSETQVDDRVFEFLKSKPVECLYLNDTLVTDVGFELWGDQPRLSLLTARCSGVTGAKLAKYSSLAYLVLRATWNEAVTDRLSNCKSLQVLYFEGSSLDQPKLEKLRSLTKLRRIDLDRATLTDAELAGIETLSALQELTLEHTAVTDAAAELLSRSKSIETIVVENTAITEVGKKALADSRMNVCLKLPEW